MTLGRDTHTATGDYILGRARKKTNPLKQWWKWICLNWKKESPDV